MSLIDDGFKLLGTLKVPALGGLVASNRILKIKDTHFTTAMLAKLKTNGDDFRLSEDEEGDIVKPLHIIDGINLSKTLVSNVAEDQLLYVWGDNAVATQPAADDAIGSEAVYASKVFNLELQESSGNPIDSAGNTSWTFSGSGSYSQAAGADDDDLAAWLSNDRMLRTGDATAQITDDNTYHLKFKANITGSSSNASVFNGGNGAKFGVSGSGDTGSISYSNGTRGASANLRSALVGHGIAQYDLVFDGSAHRLYRDGVPVWAYSYSAGMNWSGTMWLFNDFTLYVYDLSLSNNSATATEVSIESQNANAVGAWWIAEDAQAGNPEQQITCVPAKLTYRSSVLDIDSNQALTLVTAKQAAIASQVDIATQAQIVTVPAKQAIIATTLNLDAQQSVLAVPSVMQFKSSQLNVDHQTAITIVPAALNIQAATLQIQSDSEQAISVVSAIQSVKASQLDIETNQTLTAVPSKIQMTALTLSIEQDGQQEITVVPAMQLIQAQSLNLEEQTSITVNPSKLVTLAATVTLLLEGADKDLTNLTLFDITETFSIEDITPIFTLH